MSTPAYARSRAEIARSRAEILRLFDGFDLVDPAWSTSRGGGPPQRRPPGGPAVASA
ncbi:MAG TPA: hypothetical protein VHY31_10750 [Streptosporangiaceae bacterium]|nr:hypothetical protein [Streptosporangiaceae bacterium]